VKAAHMLALLDLPTSAVIVVAMDYMINAQLVMATVLRKIKLVPIVKV